MNKKILELKNISFSFKKHWKVLLKDVNFSIHTWEILSIIWINGTGKSTLLKIISGIYSPNSGEIIRNYSRLSYVPQKIQIDTTFPITIQEFIKIQNPGSSEKKLKKYLEIFKSESLLEKNLSHLSGGEMQKILIISALLSDPEIILLDEPTAGIDIIGEEIFYELISNVKKSFPDIAIILVSHNIHLVYKNSDNVLCLHKNNFCCHGTPLEMKENIHMQEIFGKYVLPYEHHPHKKHDHKHSH